MKKILIIILLFLSTGCTDYIEINDLAIVPGIIIDYKDNEYEVKAELILNNTQSSIKVITTNCKTINKCLSNISTTANKKILMQQLKVLLITKDVIKDNIDFYEYFLRNSNAKMNFNVFVIDRKYINDIFNLETNSQGVSLYIEKLANVNSDIVSSSLNLSFIDLVYKNLELGIEPLFPEIIIKNDEDKNIYLENLIFYKDSKEILLNENESIHFNILTNNVKKSVLNIKCDDNIFSLTIENIKLKKKWENRKLNFNVKINADINDYSCKYKLTDINTMKKLDKLAEVEIKNNLNNVIKISKDNNYDFLGIGNYIYKHDKKYYKEIKDKFNLNNINTNINIDVSINSIGETRR